jgi:uncharacterized protein
MMETNQNIVFDRGLYRLRKTIKQSDVLILSEKAEAVEVALDSILENRERLEDYVRLHPDYEFSLIPLEVEASAPEVVRVAGEVSLAAGIGPMAAVPGALADLALNSMAGLDSRINLVEDGGEIAAKSNRSLRVGIYAGKSQFSGSFGFLLSEEDFPIGISTSSATVSHAINFGESDATVIVAESACLADAVATAASNAVRGDDVAASVQAGLEIAKKVKGVRGALIAREEYVGTIGKLPKIMKIEGGMGELFKADLHNSLQIRSE